MAAERDPVGDVGQNGVDDAPGLAEGDPAAAARALLENFGGASADHLMTLEERRRRLHAERAAVVKDIRNEGKKRQRLLARASGLSTTDLLGVVTMRAAQTMAKAKAKAKAKATADARDR